MSEDDYSFSGISESVQFERDIVESSYSSQNFSADPEEAKKYSLILYPQEEPFYISVKIHFDTRPPYPKEPVKCLVKNCTDRLVFGHMGLSEHQIQELQEEVNKCAVEAQKNKNTAVIEIIDVVKQYIFNHNKKSCSLYDDMERANKDQLDTNKLDSLIVPIKPDKSFVKSFPPFLQPGEKRVFFRDQLSTSNSYCYNITCLGDSGDRGVFNAHDDNFKQFLIHEYVLELSPVKLKNEIESIQKDFSRTQKLNPHSSIFKYLSLNCSLSPISNVIYVLTPYSFCLSGFDKPYSNVKQLAKELISGLQFLHNQDIMHGLLTVNSIFVNQQGRHLIGDYGFAKKLLLDSLKAPFKKFSLKYPQAFKETGRHLDVLLLGHLMHHVSVGSEPDSAYPSIPSHLDPLLREFIIASVTQDKRLRPKLSDLANHDFIGETKIHISQNLEEAKINFSTEGDTDTVENFKEDGTEAWYRSNRLKNEYDLHGLLGQGGFGAVIKVRNKFDGSFYAMKVVQLSRSSKNAIATMRKEVKLLSQLKHNHIVGYNSNFVESQARQASTSSECSQHRDSINDNTSSENTYDEDDGIANGRDNSSCSIELQDDFSFQPSHHDIRSRYHEEASDCSSDKEYVSARLERETQASESDIVFEDSKKPSHISCKDESRMSENDVHSPSSSVIVMFIQMEFCENTTLRTLINNHQLDPPLYKNIDLILKLLRQIVDALEYIHSMNIIHRDLKPANIFLDAKNEVKIGDFGLAVSGSNEKGGIVGTPLYTAPEVKAHKNYTPLVDIYSLGVICFEMVKGPFQTKSERCFVLNDLQMPEVIIPDNIFCDSEKLISLEQLVRKMLNHDIKCRPKANEISQSDILPPRLGQRSLQEIVRHISSEHGSQRKDQFIGSLFSRDITNTDLTHYQHYDCPDTELQDIQFTRTMNDIIDRMMPVFDKHGAVQCPLPFLLPKCDLTDRQHRPFVLLSKLGHYQVLPCNLKLNLAKHVLKNKIKNLKRYGFTQVFRKRVDKIGIPDQNPNPRDILEGSFDIISMRSPAVAKAELILAVIDVLSALPELKKTNCTIYVNHTKIMKSILLFYKIDEIHHSEILKSIYDFSRNYTKLKEALKKECDALDERHISSLLTQFKYEGPIDKIHQHADNKDTNFKAILYKSGNKIGNLFKEGLKEILQVLLMVTSTDLSYSNILDPKRKIEDLAGQLSKSFTSDSDLGKMIKIRTGIINDPYCYNGFMFQVVIHRPDIDSKEAVVVAVGGDFQILLDQWRSLDPDEQADQCLPAAVGVNFLLEDMTNTLLEAKQKPGERGKFNRAKILITSNPKLDNSTQIFSFLKSLWKEGIHAQEVAADDDFVNEACHHVNFDTECIHIYSDSDYMKSLGVKEDKNASFCQYSDSKHLVNKFKMSKIDDALRFLLNVESRSEEQKHRAGCGARPRKS